MMTDGMKSEYRLKHDTGHKDDHDYHLYTRHGYYDDVSDHVYIVRLPLIDDNDDDDEESHYMSMI